MICARMLSAAGVLAIAWLGLAPVASAARPVLASEATFGKPQGKLLIHYATSGADAVPLADTDGDGTPDFVNQVATTGELGLDHFLMLGFRRPLDDGTLGGDGRIDIYLRDLNSADGNAGTDSCTGTHCIGYISAENDYAGYSYPSITEAIRSVVPHEIFHLVQNAYASTQPATWTEGSAVWAVENLFGAGNSDFERFLPSFITRSYRPFERPVAGFGDAYPYGAALWAYFLEHRFGVGAVVAAWAACEQAQFLDAANAALTPLGADIDAAWVEFTRWNLFTGARAKLGLYPDAAGWPAVPLEAPIETGGMVYVEGLSARYVPITVASRSRVTLAPPGGLRIAGWLVADGQGLADGVELEAEKATLTATIDAGTYTLVVTGLSRGSIVTAVGLTIDEPPDPPDHDGGCASGPAPRATALWLVAALAWCRRRRGNA